MERRFRYLLDPLFLTCVGIYLLNRFAVRPLTAAAPGFFHSSLNDLICIPFWLPPTLLLERLIRVRSHDRPPGPGEIGIHLIVWSVFFEIAGPLLPPFRGTTVADPMDIFWYSVGAAAAGTIWNVAWGSLRRPRSLGDERSPAQAIQPALRIGEEPRRIAGPSHGP